MEHEKIVSETISYSINVANSAVESLRVSNDLKTVVRVYDDGKIGIAGRIGEGDDGELLSAAKENLSQGVPYPCNLTSDVVRSEDASCKIIDGSEMVSSCRSLVKRLSEAHPDFIFSNKINTENCHISYTNSLNTSYDFKSDSIVISLTIKAAESANIMDLGYGTYQNYYDEDAICRDVDKLLSVYRVKEEIPQGVPVIISADIIQYALPDLIAEKYLSGASIFNGKLGQQVFASGLNVAVDRTVGNKMNIPFFDAEGTVCQGDKFFLIRHGEICGLFTYKRSASNFNLPLSGNVSDRFDGVPSFSVSDTKTYITCDSLKELVKGKAIYVALTSGGDMTPSGDLGLPVMLAYIYEDGKLTATLPEFTLSGNVFDVFGKDFIGIARNDAFEYLDETVVVTKFKVNK